MVATLLFLGVGRRAKAAIIGYCERNAVALRSERVLIFPVIKLHNSSRSILVPTHTHRHKTHLFPRTKTTKTTTVNLGNRIRVGSFSGRMLSGYSGTVFSGKDLILEQLAHYRGELHQEMEPLLCTNAVLP